jgi:hypothetical protein
MSDRYTIDSKPDTMAVATYERIDKQATNAATFFVDVFNMTLYVPPLTGIAVTTSLYTFLKKYSMMVTINSPTGASCTKKNAVRKTAWW